MVVVAVLTFAGAWFGIDRIENTLGAAEDEAHRAKWGAGLARHFKDFENFIAGKRLSYEDRVIVRQAARFSGAIHFRFMNADGRVVYSADAYEIGETFEPASLARLKQGRSQHRVLSAKDAAKRFGKRAEGRKIAEAVIPYLSGKDGKFLGAVAVVLDVTDAAAAWENLRLYFLAGAAILVVVIFGAGGLAVAQNIRARNRELAAIVEGHEKTKKAEAQARKAGEDARTAEGEARRAEEEARRAAEEVRKINAELAGSMEELRRTQDELLRKNRLATMGQLTGTVSHELRNPLGAIRTAVFLVDRKTRDKGLGVEKALDRITNSIRRCDNIIRELLDYTRTTELELESHEIDPWLQLTIRDAQVPTAAVKVELDLNLPDIVVAFDTERFRRVIINVVNNACEAMLGDKSDPDTKKTVNPTLTVRSGMIDERIVVFITDNGPGIPAENLDKIFEPLFSTKSFGTGLGMPTVKQIMEQHGGDIEIESEEGKGVTATIWLPRSKLVERAA